MVMAGLVSPAEPKPLRRGEGPANFVFGAARNAATDLQGRLAEAQFAATSANVPCGALRSQQLGFLLHQARALSGDHPLPNDLA